MCALLALLLSACGQTPSGSRASTATPHDPSSATLAHATVYVTLSSHRLAALRASDGTRLWLSSESAEAGSFSVGYPALADGVVYASFTDNQDPTGRSSNSGVAAFGASDGTLRWRTPTDLFPIDSPTVANGTVYAIAVDSGKPATGSLYALRASDGTLLWHIPLSDSPIGSPIVGSGLLYITTPHQLLALRAADGGVQWQMAFPAGAGSPVLTQGVIYLETAESGGSSYAFRALRASDGAVLWQHDLRQDGTSLPAAVTDTMVYVGTRSGNLVALRASDGVEQWRVQAPRSPWSTALAVAGWLYVGAGDDLVYALNSATGAILTQYRPDPELAATIAAHDSASMRWHTPLLQDGLLLVGGGVIDSFLNPQGGYARVPGMVYALTPSDGRVLWSQQTAGALQGVTPYTMS